MLKESSKMIIFKAVKENKESDFISCVYCKEKTPIDKVMAFEIERGFHICSTCEDEDETETRNKETVKCPYCGHEDYDYSYNDYDYDADVYTETIECLSCSKIFEAHVEHETIFTCRKVRDLNN
jgi:DNA-directed RNA polymerase subunit RPC12/RpoP